MPFAKRIEGLRAEGAYDMLARAQALEASGDQIIHFEVGQPDFPTFENVCSAGIAAISEGHTRYTPPVGMDSLRELIAEKESSARGMTVHADQVVISPGAKPILFFPTLALIEPGDEVIFPNPGFPTYKAMIEVAGGIPVPIPLVEENNFSFDLDAFDHLINKRTKMIILNSPSNPTGGVMPRHDLEQIAEAALRYKTWVMSDEIYSRIVFDNVAHFSIASLPGMTGRTIIIDGFSKTYSMTGWRLGFGIMPRTLAEKVGLLLTHSVGCSAHFTQYAALEALEGPQDQVDRCVSAYQKRRDVLIQGLNEIDGVYCQLPQGAFYAFPNVKEFGKTSSELAEIMLNDGGVALLPGSAFGEYGEGYLRISYASSIENIEVGLDRMKKVLTSLR